MQETFQILRGQDLTKFQLTTQGKPKVHDTFNQISYLTNYHGSTLSNSLTTL